MVEWDMATPRSAKPPTEGGCKVRRNPLISKERVFAIRRCGPQRGPFAQQPRTTGLPKDDATTVCRTAVLSGS